MKRIVTLLLVLLLAALPALAESAGFTTFDHVYGHAGSQWIYYGFPDISLFMPLDWEGRITIEHGKDGFAFFQSASYDKYLAEHIPNGGAFQTAWLDLGDYPTASAVVAGPNSYKVVCGQYALYYVNAYGGWDTMAILGKVKREDGVTHHTTDQLYKNTKTSNRGRVNYVNELTTKFTFYTHYLTNEQSARMHHLLNSPTVYLHDVAKGHVWPIVLTSNSNERKQNGLQQYAIEAELAQNRIRS